MPKKIALIKEIQTVIGALDTKNPVDQKLLKRAVNSLMTNSMSPDAIYKKTQEIILKDKEITEEDKKYLIEKFNYIDTSSNTHSLLCFTETNEKKWFAMTDFTNSLMEEYKCTTPSEKALCEIIACNYFEKLRLTNYYSASLNASEYLSHERNGYLTALWKSINRADRAYIIALNTLRDIKSPNLNIHIKTNTAIIGTNQQFNYNHSPDEIIAS